jgi:5-methylcytosine-specific restriction endonuclease McrA
VTVRSCATCQRIIPATQTRCATHEAQYDAERRAQRQRYQDPRWLELRARKAKVAGGRCEDCDTDGASEVHHRFSVKDGNPLICPLEDLLLLCHACHLRRERGHVESTLPALHKAQRSKDEPQGDKPPFVL